MVENNLIIFHQQNQYVPSTFYMLIATEYMDRYQTQVERNFPIDTNGIKTLQKMSFKFGYPLCASICAFMVFAENLAGKQQNALVCIMETPLHTYLKVFAEVEDDQKKKKLIYDDYMSKFTDFGPVVKQFGKLHSEKAHHVLS